MRPQRDRLAGTATGVEQKVQGYTLDETEKTMGAVRDQTALYGLIAKARNLGLSRIAVERRTTVSQSDLLAPTAARIAPTEPAV